MFGANVPGWPYPGQAYAGVSGPSTQTVTVGGVPSAQAFGAVTVAGGPAPQARTVTGVGSAQSFGVPTLRLWRPVGGVPSAQAFGVPVVTRSTAQVVPVQGVNPYVVVASITGQVIVGDGHLVGTSTYSIGQFGAVTVRPGVVTRTVTGVGSAGAFGVPKPVYVVKPAGVPTASRFGTPIAVPGMVRVPVSGVPTAQAFGKVFAYRVWLYVPPLPDEIILAPVSCAEATLAPVLCLDLALVPSVEE